MTDRFLDPVTTPATYYGMYGRAWQVDVTALLRKAGHDPEHDAGIALWMVEAPGAHPIWHTYMLLMMHLRPVPGLAGPVIHLRGATHEFELWALTPSAERQMILDTGMWMMWRMEPCNFAAQIIATDEEAIRRLLGSVMDILQGAISPDTDYFQWWVQLWGDSMVRDREGKR